ncbi:MAG TPA: hypothetical protein ENJ00_08645 [Phycisphaerales bacterium]|nr:hypothetical protein [Phycisphaerales bacterium]
MSRKGISWIEANFEKLIVAVMLIAFLVVLTMQFVLHSNTVEVGGKEVRLDQAFTPAEREAERLKSQLEDPNPALPENIETRDLAAEFDSLLSNPVAPADRFLAIGKPLSLDVQASDGSFATGEFAPFEPPTASGLVQATYRATLDPYAVAETEGLSTMVPSEQPYDTPWVSIQATFDGTLLRAAYERDPDGPGGSISPLPTDWWRDGAAVLAVEVERQQRGVDGQWGPAEPVDPLPGTLNLLADLDERAVNYRQLQRVAMEAARDERDVLRPTFVRLLEGDPWVPPSMVPDPSELGDIQTEKQTLLRRLATLDREIARKEAALNGTTPNSRTSNRRENRDDEGGGDADRRREANRNTNRESDANTEDARKRNIQAQIDRLKEDREALNATLEERGWSTEQSGIAPAFDPEDFEHDSPLLDTPDVQLWTHDLAVEPGATYRYRLRLVFANPLFGRKSSLKEDLHELADAKVVRSDWTQWSAPAEVSQNEYYFLTNASAGGMGASTAGRVSATAELYRFYYGYWRQSRVAVSPGDRFVGTIQLPEGLQVWDVERPATEQAWKPTPEEAEEPVEQLAGVEDQLLPTEMDIAADAWLLDIVTSPFASAGVGGQSKSTVEALIRGQDAQIANRSPKLDASSPLYAVIKASADAGAEQIPAIPGQGPRERPGGERGGDEFIDYGRDPLDTRGRRDGRDEGYDPGSGGG